MRAKILDKSADLFLNYGFKSVTMDDIANALGISKKTIYQHFDNKTKLVEATTLHMFDMISKGINCICSLEKNPIEEIYEIKRFIMEHLKDEKSSPQQYYLMQDCVVNNLNRGVELGLYRKSINIQFISRLYFNSMMSLKDRELFPLQNFSMNMLMDNYLEYHVRGICTSKGLDILKELTEINQS